MDVLLTKVKKENPDFYKELRERELVLDRIKRMKFSKSAEISDNWGYLIADPPFHRIEIKKQLRQDENMTSNILEYCKLPEMKMALQMVYGWNLGVIDKETTPSVIRVKNVGICSRDILYEICILMLSHSDRQSIISKLTTQDKRSLTTNVTIIDGMDTSTDDARILKNHLWGIVEESKMHNDLCVFEDAVNDLVDRISLLDVSTRTPDWLLFSKFFEIVNDVYSKKVLAKN